MEEEGAPSTKRGRKGITREDVERACAALQAQGRRIGPTNVRLELGTGGYGTIVRLLAELGYEVGALRRVRAIPPTT